MKIQFPAALSLIFLFLVFCGNTPAEEIPIGVGGFVLDSDVTEYPSIEYSNYLKEVVVYDWHGFKKGVISYGICDAPGKIVKIKLKYEDSSKEFFNILLEKYKKKYGKPDQWKGDAFGILHVWKWKFTDRNNRQVHMILQHNTRNPNENPGNMVKLYLPDQVVREQECFTRTCISHLNRREQEQLRNRAKTDWSYLIPRELEVE